jgi:hypothetical protein
MFVRYNANPVNARVGDCVIRAISKALGLTWEETYVGITLQGFLEHDMPSANHVWAAYLKRKGFNRFAVPNTCPDCYTVKDFCADHPKGSFVLSVDGHAIASVDGCYFDTWDSGDEVVNFYFEKVA